MSVECLKKKQRGKLQYWTISQKIKIKYQRRMQPITIHKSTCIKTVLRYQHACLPPSFLKSRHHIFTHGLSALVLRWPINQSVCKQIHHCHIKRKVTHQLRHLVTVFLITIWDTFSEDLIFPGWRYNILNMPPSVKKKTHSEPLNFSFLSSVFLFLPNFCFRVSEPLYFTAKISFNMFVSIFSCFCLFLPLTLKLVWV